MRLLYTLLFYLLLPLVLLRLCWRALRAPAYARRWAERFGFFTGPQSDQPVIWVHAVSVGETLAALPMIKALQAQYPNALLAVTTTTPTGSERVRAALGDSVFHVYAPYDLPDCLARFLSRLNPQLLIIMETELWPNTIAACAQRQIPVVLANARLSAKSARGYQRFARLAKPMVQRLSCVAAQHRDDAQRFQALGLSDTQVEVTGSIKFDLQLGETLKSEAQTLKDQWSLGGKRLLWIAASTHQGEDEQVLAAFTRVREVQPEVLLILVPRHPERFERVGRLCAEAGYRVARRSLQQAVTAETDILLGDTMGELLLLLGTSDIAYIGGSLVPTGGHNMIEAAAWGIPVVTGPHLFNFAEASRLLTEAGGMAVVETAEALADTLTGWMQMPEQRRAAGSAALAVADANRGALERLLGIIGRQLDS